MIQKAKQESYEQQATKMNETQKKLEEAKTDKEILRLDYVYPVMGLSEEAGEVSGKFAKAVRDCNGEIDSARKEAIEKELGDVCWFVAELCTLLNVSMEEVMQKNIDKLTSRKERNVIKGEGDER